MIFEFICKIDKAKDTSYFMRRCYKVAVWLQKRYNLSNDAELTYYITKENKSNNTITLKYNFT